jgi:hypothetical protein
VLDRAAEREGGGDLRAAVLGAIVHHDHLRRVVNDTLHLSQQMTEAGALIVDRDNYGVSIEGLLRCRQRV